MFHLADKQAPVHGQSRGPARLELLVFQAGLRRLARD
jgi:hypothetical protein